MIHEYAAGGLIYRLKEGKVELLIVQSNINGSWGFPKGHLEGDETNCQAAQREVLEEVGLRPKFNFDFKRIVSYTVAKNRQKTVNFFLAKAVSNQVVKLQDSEIMAAKWIDYSQAEKFLRYPDLIKIFADVLDYLNKEG